MADDRSPNAKPRPDVPRRRPYRTPRLARLGTLTELTATVGTQNKNDHGGAHPPFTKTS